MCSEEIENENLQATTNYLFIFLYVFAQTKVKAT